MITITVKGYGEAKANEAMMSRFVEMTKKEIVAKIAEQTKQSDKTMGVAFWREYPKEVLLVVVADMFANDLERAGKAAADAEPATLESVTEHAHDANIPQGDSLTPLKIEGAAKGDANGVNDGPTEAEVDYVLRCTVLDGYLRRDQPRKTADTATWKRVDTLDRASRFRTLRQATAKLAEIASLYDDRDHQCELSPIARS